MSNREAMESRVLAAMTGLGGAVVLGAIMRSFMPGERKLVQNALRRMWGKNKVFLVRRRYWAVWK